MASRRFAIGFGLFVALVALVVACGGGGGDKKEAKATSTPKGNVADRALDSIATQVGGVSIPGPIGTAVGDLRTTVAGVDIPGPLATAAAGIGIGGIGGDLGSLLDDKPSTLRVRNTPSGRVLTDAKGLTLYTSTRDTSGSGKSNVTGDTLKAWPAYILATGNPTKSDGISGAVTLINRDDGSKQVAYKGLPLYYWQNDKAPGDVTGNGVGGFAVAMP